jgi:hypothetical protein
MPRRAPSGLQVSFKAGHTYGFASLLSLTLRYIGCSQIKQKTHIEWIMERVVAG